MTGIYIELNAVSYGIETCMCPLRAFTMMTALTVSCRDTSEKLSVSRLRVKGTALRKIAGVFEDEPST